mgnify:CR=1 FL=1
MHAMRKLIILLSALVYVIHAQAQFSVTAHQEGWNNIPPQVQKPGFSFQQSVLANMDGDDALEEVMLFGRDNGHYPTFDLFKAYYAIVDNYTGHITCRHKGGGSKRAYRLIDFLRNKDGISELYISYFKDGKFSVDEQGYNLRTTRCYDRIEWNPTGKNFKSSGK